MSGKQVSKIDKVKEIIDKSGNDLHQEVVDFLRADGWEVKSSPYYNDPATNKPREIDVIAKKNFKVTDWAADSEDVLTIRLFIECKHISGSNVIWFENKNMPEAIELAKNNRILRGVEDIDLMISPPYPPVKHHYVREADVAKRWNSSGHTDPVYEAMNGVLNGQIFFKDQHERGERYVIDYPIIVVDSYTNLHRRDTTNALGYTNILSDFPIEVDYSYTDKEKASKTGYFLIDVVDKAGLGGLLNDLESSDVNILKARLGSELRAAMFQARQNREPESYDPFSSF